MDCPVCGLDMGANPMQRRQHQSSCANPTATVPEPAPSEAAPAEVAQEAVGGEIVPAAGSELVAVDAWREEWRPIVAWLTELGLEELAWNFIDAGYTDVEAIKEEGLTSEDWKYLEIKHPAHRYILKAGKRMPIEYDKYGNPFFVEERKPPELAMDNAQLMSEHAEEAENLFQGQPDLVPCATFCGPREGYVFTTRFHKQVKSREEEAELLDDRGKPKDGPPTVTEKLAKHLKSGLVTGYYKDTQRAVLSGKDAKEFAEGALDGPSLREAMASSSVLYDPALHKYAKKKLKVFLRYESWKPGVLPEHKSMRSAIKISEKWLDVPVQQLMGHYLAAYNSKHPDMALPVSQCRLAIKDKSFLLYSKKVVPGTARVGDSFKDAHEVYVVTEQDRTRQASEIRKLITQLKENAAMVSACLTITKEDIEQMKTVKEEGDIDETVAHALLVGLGTTYAVPVTPSMTMADMKLFISLKSGLPLDAVDLATATKHKAIENDIDINIVEDDETMEDHSRRVNQRTITGPVHTGCPRTQCAFRGSNLVLLCASV
eukprot:TRINITY_DN4322_c0_g1_i1.p1 TRINITY_DN4322_c0_g1~~TRINITY_DN4322_c0_g1_i1.p1  ORF type:complete len:544 (-),score=161.22 TRINITY_DN4322_c0_g1_i1:313-1944(-)